MTCPDVKSAGRGQIASALAALVFLSVVSSVHADPLPTQDYLNVVAPLVCIPGEFASMAWMAQGADGSVYMAGSDAYGSGCAMKFSAGGQLLWQTSVVGTSGFVEVAGITVDGAGNAYVSITDGDGYPGTAFIMKYGPGGTQAQTLQMPIPAGVGTTFGAGAAFDRTRGILYAAEYYDAPNGPTALIASYNAGLTLQNQQTATGFNEAVLSLDAAGNAYVGGDGIDGTGNSVYLAVEYAPGLTAQQWTATQPFALTRFSRESNVADPNGGMIFLGLEAASGPGADILRRVTAKGSFAGAVNVPGAQAGGYLLSDAQSAAYAQGSTSDGSQAGMIKVDTSGALVWGASILSDGAQYNQLAALVGQGEKIYSVGVDGNGNGYLARYSQGGGQQLKITLGAAQVSPASPPTIPRVALAGNPSTSVEIDLVDATGALLAQQAAVNVAVTETAFSGGHAHDNARPVGLLSGTGIAAGSSVSGTTDTNGKLFLVYTSTTIGGQETISATLANNASVSASAVVNVAVVDRNGRNLIDFSTLPIASFVNLTGSTGQTSYGGCLNHLLEHPSNHWATGTTLSRALLAIQEFYLMTGVKVGVNDMGLPDGGMFDICGDWQLVTYIPAGFTHPTVKGHKCHRGGNSIDIDKKGLTKAQILTLTNAMNAQGGQKVNEGPLHYQFPGVETCFGTGGQ